MPRLQVTNRAGEVREIRVAASQTLMEALRDEGFDIEALCGGCCSCATCHVHIDAAWAHCLPAMSEDEDCLLEGSQHYVPGASRLSCQLRLTQQMDGLKLTIAPPDE